MPRRWPLAGALLLAAGAAGADPILSIDITPAPGEPYDQAVLVARDLGAQATSFSILWDEMEPEPGVFAPKDNWPAIANIYFPTTGLSFSITFSVIDTTADRRPADLRGLPWDDPQVIARFVAHAQAVLSRMPRVDFLSITVGNEVDVALTDAAQIAAYGRFLQAVRPQIAQMRPGVPFGTKLTFIGLTTRDLTALTGAGDAVFATYYPLGAGFRIRPVADVPGDIATLAALAGDRPLWLSEAGYPSQGCDAPEGGQAAFVETLFATARETPSLHYLSYTFLSDLSEPEVDRLTAYYGLPDDCFRRYLSSIGLRDASGQLKPAAETYRALARP